MNKHSVLQELSFGRRVAEEEIDQLAAYFVETDLWRRIYGGDIDVVYGPKGSGKSAIYSILVERASELFDRGILIQPAENPRGTPAFADLIVDPPTTEYEFVSLWKLYLLQLIASVISDFSIDNEASRYVIEVLEDAGFKVRPKPVLKSLLHGVRDYVRRAQSVEGQVTIGPDGTPTGLVGRITFREPNAAESAVGFVSVDALLQHANDALVQAGYQVWIMLDRLDVAFSETPDLERNALRALFKVYLDIGALGGVSMKIFLRTDIWAAISARGFREGSHITKQMTIEWDRASLLKLVIQRLLRNDGVLEGYAVSPEAVLASIDDQTAIFYRVFPDQIDLGTRRPQTFDWLLGHVRDGKGIAAPRELIHLLSESRNVQMQRLETGEPEPEGERLFDRQAIRDALAEVSRVKLEQTLYTEYESLKPLMEGLAGERTLQTVDSLATIWKVSEDEALLRANSLVDIGFFEARGTKAKPTFWVPFLHRSALKMIQGSADTDDGDE